MLTDMWLLVLGVALALAAVGAAGYLIYSMIKRKTGIKADLGTGEDTPAKTEK